MFLIFKISFVLSLIGFFYCVGPSLTAKVLLTGGPRKLSKIEINKQLSHFFPFLDEKVQKDYFLEQDSKDLDPKIQQIKSATVQVVQGLSYNISFVFGEDRCKNSAKKSFSKFCLDCNALIWSRPWLPVTERLSIKSKCDKPLLTRAKRYVVGSIEYIDPSNQMGFDLIQFVEDSLNKKTLDGVPRLFVTKVNSVHRQLVNGYKYVFEVQMCTSHCKKLAKKSKRSDCPLDQSQLKNCQVIVYEQAWKKKRFILGQFKCLPVTSSLSAKKTYLPPFLLGGAPLTTGSDFNEDISTFKSFREKFNKTYNSKEEEKMRAGIFNSNVKRLSFLRDHDRGTAQYGVTKFADLTEKEFKKLLGLNMNQFKHDPTMPLAKPLSEKPPAAFDWRTVGAVTPVKNQGSCGSCWAFSTTGNVEGQWFIKKKQLISLSEQELVDCDKLDSGCEGGLPVDAYKSIRKLGGLEPEKDYPYKGSDDKCVLNRQDLRVYINGSLNISSDEQQMAAWLAKNGPISIGINALFMQFYLGGISHPWSWLCNPDSLDHGVLIVGYGVHKGWFENTPYWIIKNSWGPDWGEQGYYLVYRGGGVCGLNKMATSSIVL